jgi:uncharacterized protein YbbK (DUF523 family)
VQKILVSACLLGEPVRWDGGARPLDDPRIAAWRAEGRLVALCPERAAGLPVPRPPVEIETGGSGAAVVAGSARVLGADGTDFSAAFRRGAAIAVERAAIEDVRFALLCDGSPSCGSRRIADGRFAGRRVPGRGVVAERLTAAGITVFPAEEIDALEAAITATEAATATA